MKIIGLTICAALAAWGQPPAPKLTCAETRFYVNGLAPYCELRETTLSAPVTALAVKIAGSGNISVQPWDGAEVLVRAQVVAGAETTYLAQVVAGQVVLDTSSGSVNGSGPVSNNRQTWALHLEIYLPRESGLTLETINGNVTVEDVQGRINASLTNGNLSVAGATGAIDFRSTNGNVSLTRVSGDITGRGTNGRILIEVGEWRRQTIQLKSVNGGIDLDVPRDCAAHVELSTVLGSIITNVASGNWTSAGIGKKVSFDLGGGGPLLHAELVTGYVKLRQAE